MKGLAGLPVPERNDIELLIQLFEQHLFPRSGTQSPIDPLRQQLAKVLSYANAFFPFEPETITDRLLSSLDAIREDALKDALLFIEDDPAAHYLEEIVFSYPGFRAILIYRVAHTLVQMNVPIIPRMLSEGIHSRTGVDINPGATIAVPFFIDHGTGIVIGETAVVGKNVRIYQGVTLGALAVRKEDAGVKRHPTVQNDVIIYANSTILGGDTVIGHNSVIGGNSWLTSSVPAYSVVYTEHKTIVRDRESYKQPIDFSI